MENTVRWSDLTASHDFVTIEMCLHPDDRPQRRDDYTCFSHDNNQHTFWPVWLKHVPSEPEGEVFVPAVTMTPDSAFGKMMDGKGAWRGANSKLKPVPSQNTVCHKEDSGEVRCKKISGT